MKVYVVMGETHISYEGTYYWIARVFIDKKKATEHAKKAEARAKEVYESKKKKGERVINSLANFFDRKAQMADTLPEYYVETTTLTE